MKENGFTLEVDGERNYSDYYWRFTIDDGKSKIMYSQSGGYSSYGGAEMYEGFDPIEVLEKKRMVEVTYYEEVEEVKE